MTKHAVHAKRPAHQPRPQRRHPLYFEEGTWTRAEIMRRREQAEAEVVTRHQPSQPSALAR